MTIVVFLVSKPGTLATRLFLPKSEWGEVVIAHLEEQGYTFSECADQTRHPEPRDDAELARRDALLELIAY